MQNPNISIQSAPRDPAGLAALNRSTLYRLAYQLELFADQSVEQAWLATPDDQKVNAIMAALQAYDARGGQPAPAMQQPTGMPGQMMPPIQAQQQPAMQPGMPMGPAMGQPMSMPMSMPMAPPAMQPQPGMMPAVIPPPAPMQPPPGAMAGTPGMPPMPPMNRPQPALPPMQPPSAPMQPPPGAMAMPGTQPGMQAQPMAQPMAMMQPPAMQPAMSLPAAPMGPPPMAGMPSMPGGMPTAAPAPMARAPQTNGDPTNLGAHAGGALGVDVFKQLLYLISELAKGVEHTSKKHTEWFEELHEKQLYVLHHLDIVLRTQLYLAKEGLQIDAAGLAKMVKMDQAEAKVYLEAFDPRATNQGNS